MASLQHVAAALKLPLGLLASALGEGVLLVFVTGALAVQAVGTSLSSETIVGGLLVLLVGGMLMRNVGVERRALDTMHKLREDFAKLYGRLDEIGSRITAQDREVAAVYGAFGAEREVAKRDRHDLRGELMGFTGEIELRMMEHVKRIEDRIARTELRLENFERRLQ